MRPETDLSTIQSNTLEWIAEALIEEPGSADEALDVVDRVPVAGFLFHSIRGDTERKLVALIADNKRVRFEPEHELDGTDCIRFHDEKAVAHLSDVFGFTPTSAKVVKGKRELGKTYHGWHALIVEWKFLTVSAADYAEAQRRKRVLVVMRERGECALAAGLDQIYYDDPD